MSLPLYATVPLGPQHNRTDFSCGTESLDRYLKQQSSQDVKRKIAQAFVRCAGDTEDVIGYYTLSMTAIELDSLPAALSRRLPRYPRVPAALLGRLAVDTRAQGTGLGRMLLLDAMRRSYEASRGVAAYGLVVDAIDERAARFYRSHEFVPLTTDGARLILPMATIASLFPWVTAGDEPA